MQDKAKSGWDARKIHVFREEGCSEMDNWLNAGFFVVHTAWIGFICLGWIARATRQWQIAAAMLTTLSWFGLGFWYGWGYCPCTDWHWEVRSRMGLVDPPSYVQLLIREVTGIMIEPGVADALAFVTLATATLLSVMFTVRDRARGYARNRPQSRVRPPAK
jgi:hypothetical protein